MSELADETDSKSVAVLPRVGSSPTTSTFPRISVVFLYLGGFMPNKKTFLMIDGSSLLFRAFYAIRNLRTSDGMYTNGVYGFLMMYWKAVDMVKPDYIIVAFDRSEPTFRAKDYKDYKANRPETPSELSAQFGITKDILNLLGVKQMDMKGFEADDIIGTLSKKAEEAGLSSYLLTGDRDYFQLVDDNTRVLYTKKGISQLEIVDVDWIEKKYGLEPKDLIEIKGLQGDPSDNIPGVPGVGEKTALKLVKKYGNIDKVYENLDQISGKKLKENLSENRNQAFMSRELGTILRDIPMEEQLEDFIPRSPDKEKLNDRFQTLEFRSFAERFSPEKKEKRRSFPAQFVDPEDWKELYKNLSRSEEIAFAIFPDGENYIHSQPVYAAFLFDQKSYLLSIKGKEKDFHNIFAPLFDESGPRFLAYDIKESILLLKKLGIDFKNSYEDIMLMEYLMDPQRTSYDISSMAHRLLGINVLSRQQLLGKGAKRKNFQDLEEDQILSYSSGLLSVIQEGRAQLLQKLEEMGMKDLYFQLENPLALVLAHMEISGIAVDKEVLKELDKEISASLEDLEATIYDYAGKEFNINSPQQLGDVLFVDLKLPHGKKNKTGYSTAAPILEKIRDEHPIVDAVLKYRQFSKLKSTYVDGFLPYINEDGRIRSIFRQNVTATGRLSSTEPNLQNIPVRTEMGRKFRAVFVAKEGDQLIDADYSQIELRVLAALSGDETMIHAFQQGHDIHRKTAAEINHKEISEVTALERSMAKAVNFGIIYGISDYGLSQNLNISRKEAKEYIESYKNTYPGIKKYMSEIVEKAKENGYVKSYYGRYRAIPELRSKNFNIRSFGQRVALNTPIQGTAADIIKLAMIKVDRLIQKEYKDKARLVLQIHDELIVEADEDIAVELSQKVKEIMESIGEFQVKLIADTNIGKSWYDVK